jgi:hypothetical protein
LNISSDLDIDTQLYAIEDSEFCDTLIISSVSLLTPGTIQKISQVIASAPQQKRHQFPVLTCYFAAKAKNLRFVCADLLCHRELIQAGDPSVFMHEDHPKLLYIIQMKYRAAKKTYRKYRDEVGSDDEMDINIIKHHMLDVRKFYESALPLLNMLAAHHNLQFDGSDMSQDGLASLRSEGAQTRREASSNNDLRDKLRNMTEYVNEQSKVQSQGLHRLFDHQGRALADRDEELDRIRTQSKQEITKRRQTEDDLSQVREDLRLATEENRAYQTQRQFDSTPQQDIDTRQCTYIGGKIRIFNLNRKEETIHLSIHRGMFHFKICMVHDNKINTTHSIAKINITQGEEEIIVKHIMIVGEDLLHCHRVRQILDIKC